VLDLRLADSRFARRHQVRLDGTLMPARGRGGELHERARALVQRASLRAEGVTGGVDLLGQLRILGLEDRVGLVDVLHLAPFDRRPRAVGSRPVRATEDHVASARSPAGDTVHQ